MVPLLVDKLKRLAVVCRPTQVSQSTVVVFPFAVLAEGPPHIGPARLLQPRVELTALPYAEMPTCVTEIVEPGTVGVGTPDTQTRGEPPV